MRSAEVHLHGKLTGHLIQTEEGYTFTYAPPHLLAELAQLVSLTLPLRAQPYVERLPTTGLSNREAYKLSNENLTTVTKQPQ